MAELARDSAATSVVALLAHYSFDGGGLTVEQLVDQWLRRHSVQWVRLALIEALYQGRYKAISVTQILAFWQRRDRPLYRFDSEFEQLICNRLPTRPSANGQHQIIAPASVTNTKTHAPAKAPQASLKKQPRTSISTSPPPQATSERILGATHPIANQSEEMHSPAELLLSSKPMKPLRKVALLAQANTEQSNSAASNSAQPTLTELGSSIHRFTPSVEASSFHTKLSALAQRLRQDTLA